MDKKKSKVTEAGRSAEVLIPVDFSPNRSVSYTVGFALAERLKRDAVLLHASVVATPMVMPQFPDDFNGMDNENAEIEEMELDREVHFIDEAAMRSLKKKLNQLQEAGKLPDVKFSSVIAPGMPEEVIKEYCALKYPEVVVMATRGKEKRKEELIGSVTAEVIDNCIAPVFTVPEDYNFNGFKDIVRICAFINFDESDFACISELMRIFGNPDVSIYLLPAIDRKKADKKTDYLDNLKAKLQSSFPNVEFIIAEQDVNSNVIEDATAFFTKERIQLLLIPNRKKGVISRLFNPGLAHKILYAIDFPMLVIPVY